MIPSSNIIPFKTKYPLTPVPEAFNRITKELEFVAGWFAQQGDSNIAGDIREAAYFIGKVARELEEKI